MKFMIRKTFALLATISIATHAFAIDDTIIPQASYLVYERDFGNGPDSLSKEVTFYTFDGNPIITMEHHWTTRTELLKKIDPSAPKPQPVSYEISKPRSVWDPFLVVMGVQPPCFIIFYDQHDNVIAKFDCYKKRKTLSIIVRNPAVQPGRIGEFTRITVPNFEFLKTNNVIIPLDLSRVSEKPNSKKLK